MGGKAILRDAGRSQKGEIKKNTKRKKRERKTKTERLSERKKKK